MASVRMTHELRCKITREAERTFKKANPESNLFTDDFHQLLRSELQNSPIQKYLQKVTALPEYVNVEALKISRREMSEAAESGPIPYRGYDFRQEAAYPKLHTIRKVYMPTPLDFDSSQTITNSYKTADDLWNEYEANGYNFDPTSRYSFRTMGINLKTPLKLIFPNQEGTQDEVWVSYNEISTEHREEVFKTCAQANLNRNEIDRECKEYLRGIKGLVEECNTVKQLLDAWPAAENLLPDGIMARLHEKSDKRARTTRVKEKVNFDATAANQIVLTAKLAS